MNNKPERQGHRALRKGRVSIPGQVYLLTTTTAGRHPLFGDYDYAHVACRHIHATDTWLDARLLCWVLMPDHWHGLVALGESANLSQVMNRCKAIVSRAIHRQGHAGPVWARGFHDHALRREEGVLQAARYIVANPLRAGLVQLIGQYPWWNSVWLDSP